MKVQSSVIQTTAKKHADRKRDSLEAAEQYLRLTTPMSDAEIGAYIKGASDFWGFATFAIMQDGNCDFERED